MKNGIGERARPGRRTHPLAPSRLRSGVGRRSLWQRAVRVRSGLRCDEPRRERHQTPRVGFHPLQSLESAIDFRPEGEMVSHRQVVVMWANSPDWSRQLRRHQWRCD